MIDSTYIFLNSIRKIDANINRLLVQKDELEKCLLPSGIRYDKDRVQTSPEDTFSKICADISEIDAKLEALAGERRNQVNKVMGAIAKIPKDEEQTVIIRKYIYRESIRTIARAVGYSEDNVKKLRRKGVDHLTEILEGGK